MTEKLISVETHDNAVPSPEDALAHLEGALSKSKKQVAEKNQNATQELEALVKEVADMAEGNERLNQAYLEPIEKAKRDHKSPPLTTKHGEKSESIKNLIHKARLMI